MDNELTRQDFINLLNVVNNFKGFTGSEAETIVVLKKKLAAQIEALAIPEA